MCVCVYRYIYIWNHSVPWTSFYMDDIFYQNCWLLFSCVTARNSKLFYTVSTVVFKFKKTSKYLTLKKKYPQLAEQCYNEAFCVLNTSQTLPGIKHTPASNKKKWALASCTTFRDVWSLPVQPVRLCASSAKAATCSCLIYLLNSPHWRGRFRCTPHRPACVP